MLAAERGAAANTIAAYGRDLRAAREEIGDLVAADSDALAGLAEAWRDLAPSSLARKSSALRQFYGFLADEGLRGDDPSAALPRPRTRRPLPRLLGHGEIGALFALAESEAASGEGARMLALPPGAARGGSAAPAASSDRSAAAAATRSAISSLCTSRMPQ